MKYLLLFSSLLFLGCASSKKQSSFQWGIAKSSRSHACLLEEKDSLTKLVSRANRCYKEEKWKDLKKIAVHMQRNYPKQPWGVYYRSLLAEKSQKYELSLWMIEIALKKDPQNALFLYQKARVQWALGDNFQAQETFEKLEDQRLTPYTSVFLGNLAFQFKNCSKAIRFYEKVSQSSKQDVNFYRNYGHCLIQEKDYEIAETLLRKGLNYYPKDPDLLILSAKAKKKEVLVTGIQKKETQ